VLCLEFIVVTATVDVVQCYCVLLEFIVVTATIGILQWYCVLCGIYCGYRISRYSAMVLCLVWSLLWLQQHLLWCNGTVLCWSLLWLQQQ